MRGRRTTVLLAALAALATWGTGRAEVRPYTIEIPDRAPVSYQLQFRVEHPGTLGILAEWAGPRILSFRLEREPGRVHRARRSGPSPQRIEVEVHPWDLQDDPQWTLSIRALPGRGSGSGLITLDLPDPVVERVEPLAAPTPPPPRRPTEPWARARRVHGGATEHEVRLFDAVERFRQLTVDSDGGFRPDGCRWQSEALRYLAGWRDKASDRGDVPPIASRRYLNRIVQSIRSVEELRDSDDPILAGPAPTDRRKLRAWLALRRQRIEPVEREIDALDEAVESGHAPELRAAAWPGRLLSCLAACERYFEERVRLGEERASNRDMAEVQWIPMLAAADALEALVYFSPPVDGKNREDLSELRRP